MGRSKNKKNRHGKRSQEKKDQEKVQHSAGIYLPIFILLLAAVLRMIYGYNLPLNVDEQKHLEFARTISLKPDHFNLPMGSRVSNHPILSSYITALANWAGNNSVYFIRCVFIGFSLFGLAGLFQLARTLFGFRVANIALLFAALDHHLISYAPVFLEPVYFCLVPWLILAVYKAVTLEQNRQWLLIGLYCGIGYQCSEIFILQALPTCIYVVYSRQITRVLKTREFYLAVILFVLIILPNLIWNFNNQAANIVRHTERVSSLGLVPRVLLLYIGDFLICFKNSSWWVMGLGNKTYLPWNIPCHWVTGFLYLGALCYSFRFVKEKNYIVLHFYVWAIFLPASVLNANEPWNEFGWASMTVFPVVIITSGIIESIINVKWGRLVYAMAIIFFSAYTAVFLAGPKFTYASPVLEKSFLGQFLTYYYFTDDNIDKAKALVEETEPKCPDCAIVHYFKGLLAKSTEEREASFNRVLEKEPYNPLVAPHKAKALMRRGKNREAIELLETVIAKKGDFVMIRELLAQAEFNMRNYAGAENQIKQGLRIKPDEFYLYRILYLVKERQGELEEGLEALDRYAMSTGVPHKVYISEAYRYKMTGKMKKALLMYEKAREKKPDLSETPPWVKQVSSNQ